MRFTPTSLTINQLLNSANEQYTIPTYQRRYSWVDKQIWELLDDVRQIEDGDQHLLGSIVCLAGHHRAGLNHLEVVDGQQRLTTIVILLHCIKERLERENDLNAARDIAALLSAFPPNGEPVPKVLLDSIDAEEFREHIANHSSDAPKNLRLAHAFEVIRNEAAEATLGRSDPSRTG
jgi:uncharacterized protein with ParB-like and HNH nuclease domain